MGRPFLIVVVEGGPFPGSFLFESTTDGLARSSVGLNELAVGVDVLCNLSADLRTSSLALRFGEVGKAGVVGLGSPVIWARRSPILSILC